MTQLTVDTFFEKTLFTPTTQAGTQLLATIETITILLLLIEFNQW